MSKNNKILFGVKNVKRSSTFPKDFFGAMKNVNMIFASNVNLEEKGNLSQKNTVEMATLQS